MQLNIKLQNVIIVAGFLLTVILCLEYDIRANAITTPSQASQFIFPRAMDAWDVAFACMAGVAAVLFFYIGFRYKAIRREKGTSLLSSLVFSSATYQGSSYVLFVLRTLFTSGEDMNAIVQVGFKMYLPLGILAMLFFCFVVIEVFLKPAISQEKQHRIEIAIQALQAFGIIIGIIITLFVYTVNGSTFEIAFGAIGFSVFGLIVLVVIYVIVQIIKDFFLSKGLPWDRYVSEIGKFNGIMVEWGTIDAKAVVETALSLKATMPFRENVRDFIIGTQCNQLDLFLITYNTHHFEWCKHAPITPEDFILSC